MDAASLNAPTVGDQAEGQMSPSSALLTQRGYWRRCHESATHQPSAPMTESKSEPIAAATSSSDVIAREAQAAATAPVETEVEVGIEDGADAPPAAETTETAVETAHTESPARDVQEEVENVEVEVAEARPDAAAQSSSAASRSASSSSSSSSSSGIPTTGSRFDILMQSNSGSQGGSGGGDRDAYRSVVRKATRACHHPQERHKDSNEGTAEKGSTGQGIDSTPQGASSAATPSAPAPPVGELMAIPAKAPFKRLQAQPFSHVLVCDFEATCESGSVHFPHEIIEFPVVVVDTATLRVVAEFHHYVRPVKHPKLTRFCTELTGITQATVDAAETLPVVVERFQAWLESVVYPLCRAWRQTHDPSAEVSALSTNLRSEQKRFTFDESSETTTANISEEKMICFATDGPWDMRRFMHECSVLRDGIEFPPVFYRYINVRHAYSELFKVKQVKLTHMLKRMGMTFEGQRHSGICDTRNIARVLAEVMARGYRVHHVSMIKYSHRGDRFLEHNQLARELLEEEAEEKLLKSKQKNKHKDPAASGKAGTGGGGGSQHVKGAPRSGARRATKNR